MELDATKPCTARSPITGKVARFTTTSPEFYTLLKEISATKFNKKLGRELNALARADAKWLPVYDAWQVSKM
jgi:hypothetical protein